MRIPGSDAVRMALTVPIRNPGRSVLTALGLAIGVGAFIAMVSFGQGARSSVVSQFETLGSNVLRVKTYFGVSDGVPHLLDQADVAALEREATTLAAVIPHVIQAMDISTEHRRYRAMARGTTPGFLALDGAQVAQGGIFNAADLQERAKVCVLGSGTASELFGAADPLGQVVVLDNRLPCRVIGVLAARGVAVSGRDLDDRVLLPVTTFERYLGMPNGLSLLEIEPQSPELLDAAKREVAAILRRTHRIAPGAQDDFNLQTPDELTRVADRIGGILTALLAGIASVSLLVGGIGIMNIQLVSVSERTQEIGIRAAVGASSQQIMRQFLAEALVLAGIGSAAGAALGVGAATVVASRFGWPDATSPEVVVGAVSFGVAVGTVFGYLPAKRAASLDPIEALREE